MNLLLCMKLAIFTKREKQFSFFDSENRQSLSGHNYAGGWVWNESFFPQPNSNISMRSFDFHRSNLFYVTSAGQLEKFCLF